MRYSLNSTKIIRKSYTKNSLRMSLVNKSTWLVLTRKANKFSHSQKRVFSVNSRDKAVFHINARITIGNSNVHNLFILYEICSPLAYTICRYVEYGERLHFNVHMYEKWPRIINNSYRCCKLFIVYSSTGIRCAHSRHIFSTLIWSQFN